MLVSVLDRAQEPEKPKRVVFRRAQTEPKLDKVGGLVERSKRAQAAARQQKIEDMVDRALSRITNPQRRPKPKTLRAKVLGVSEAQS